MTFQFPQPSGETIVASTLADMLDPGEAITPAQYAAKSLVVPDGPRAGEKWSAELTPYLVEPINFWADDCPDNKAAVRKSKQTGFTTAAIVCCGYTAEVEPCDVFLIEPTSESLSDFLGEKLSRAIEGSPSLKKKIRAQTSRSGRGSTTKSKKFAGGSLLCGIATSTADLRGKTRRKVIRDEASEYPGDLGGQGSPHDMITGAYESFLASGDYKDFWISTPVVEGACAIDREFDAGDQRFWHVRCPLCCTSSLDEIRAIAPQAGNIVEALRAIGVFYFDRDPKGFRYSKTFPHNAHYCAPCCGGIIESWQRNDLVRAGIGTAPDGEVIGWIATAPAAGKHRSYHFDALSSPFVPWDVIAKRIVDAGDDPAKLKTLDNLTFGRAHKVRGNAPDHKALEARREKDLKRGHVPPRGLILVAFADVQMRGIWFEVMAIAPNRETWTVEAQYIEGDTSNPHGEVFAQLKRETIDREFPDAFGRKRKIDALAVDSGYRAHVVYSVVRNAQRLHPTTGRDMILATKGLKGWGRPALGMPQLVDIDLDGKKIAQGCKVWGIGTWSLKAGVYSDLFLEVPPLVAGQAPPIAPDGYCHFGAWIDEEYFKQLTAESLQNVVHRGRVVGREWVARGPNHFFDCRVGNIALAEYLGLSSTTPEEWAELARVRGLPDEMTRVDLFTPRAAAPPTVPTAPAAKAAGEAAPAAEAWVAPSNNWMRRG